MRVITYKRILSLALIIVLTLMLSACGRVNAGGQQGQMHTADLQSQSQPLMESTEGNSESTEGEPGLQDGDLRIWTDSLGREVKLPETVERIALAGPLAQIVLYALAPEKLVGYSSDWTADEEQYIPEEYRRLPYLGQLYGGKGEMNLEELLAAAPDVVIDVGPTKDRMAAELDGLSSQTGIPFVHVTMTLENAGDAFRMLGDLLSLEERAEEYAAYCESVYARAQDIMARVASSEKQAGGAVTDDGQLAGGKKKALYVLGPEGLHVIARSSYHSELMDFFTDNLAVLDNPSSKGTGNEVDMEQILKWNPEVIVFGPDSICADVSTRPEWQAVKAIADRSYFEVPFGPYNWMGFPPSVQCCLGMLWLPQMLYPEYCDYNLKEEVVKYYAMFYHCELSDAQYEKLVGGESADVVY